MKYRNYICFIMLFTLFFCIGSSTKIAAYKGVLDRVENDQAIILLETIDQTVIVPKESLPVGSQVSTWFNIELVDQTYKVVDIDDELTKEQQQETTRLMNKLRNIKDESKYKRMIESID